MSKCYCKIISQRYFWQFKEYDEEYNKFSIPQFLETFLLWINALWITIQSNIGIIQAVRILHSQSQCSTKKPQCWCKSITKICWEQWLKWRKTQCKLLLEEYGLMVIHTKGKLNPSANTLSRIPMNTRSEQGVRWEVTKEALKNSNELQEYVFYNVTKVMLKSNIQFHSFDDDGTSQPLATTNQNILMNPILSESDKWQRKNSWTATWQMK